MGRRIGHAFVKDHGDVRAESPLNLHHLLGCKEMFGAIDMGLKGDSILRDLPQFCEAEDLITAAIRQNRPLPVDETMEPSQPAYGLMAGFEVEVIGVS